MVTEVVPEQWLKLYGTLSEWWLKLYVGTRMVASVVDPDPVGSDIICRIRIRYF